MKFRRGFSQLHWVANLDDQRRASCFHSGILHALASRVDTPSFRNRLRSLYYRVFQPKHTDIYGSLADFSHQKKIIWQATSCFWHSGRSLAFHWIFNDTYSF